MTRLAPCAASRRAMAYPMPARRLTPVTNATRPRSGSGSRRSWPGVSSAEVMIASLGPAGGSCQGLTQHSRFVNSIDPCLRRECSVSAGLGGVMSNDWPRGWYSDEPDQAGGAGGQRPQPSFTPNSPGPRGQRPPDPAGRGWYAPGNAGGGGSRDAGGPGPGNRTAWPAQPPSGSWTGGGGGAGGGAGGGGYRPRGWRRWLRPRRILAILAGLVALIVVAAVAVYFSVNSKLTKVDVLTPVAFTSAGTNWLITGSDSRAGLSKKEENQLALGHDISGSRSDTILLLHVPANGTRPTLVSLPRDSYVPIPR